MEDDQKAKQQMLEVNPTLDQKSKGLEQSGDLLRRLQAITDAARIVIRATDEVRMLEEVCRIIVEIGGYRLAWVGYAEADNGKNVRPVAHKGFEDGYLDTVNISWADTARGHGPTGTAIRTGKTVIAQNIHDQEGYDPWRNQALQRGYAASIAVPFTFAGTCRGALNVYAAEPQAFDVDEAKLMEELAQDLAFGISSLRVRTESRRTEEALRESEARLHGIVENTQAGYFYMDRQGFYRHVNAAWLRMHGYDSPDEIIGQHFTLTQVDVDQDTAQESVVTLLAGDAIPTGEFSRRCRDGSVQYHTFSAHPVFQAGKVVGLEGFIIDATERKRAEDNLRKEESLRNILIDNLPCIALILKKGSREIVASNKAARAVGAVPGKTCYETCANRDDMCPFCLAPELWKTNESHSVEVEYRGTYYLGIWVPLSDDLYVHYIFDITERKQAEAALLVSKERFQRLFLEAPLGIALIDSLTGHIYEVNPMFAQIAGRTMEEMVQINWMSITHPDDVQEDLDNMALLNAGKTDGFQMEKRYLHHDGTVVWINMTIAKIEVENKEHPRHLCMIEDITERKQAAEKLRVSEERFAQMAEQAREMIWEVDAKGLFTYVSQGCDLITGYRPDEIMAKAHFYDLHPEAGRESFKTSTLAIIERKESFSGLLNVILAKDGREVWVSTNAIPVLDIQGNLTGYRGSDYDITDRLMMEEEKAQLEAQNRQLQKAESLGRMAGAIAHTFNNQLGVVIGNLEMAIDDLPNGSGPAHNLLSAAMRAANKAAEVSGQMLTYLGQSFDKHELMDLAEVCRRNLPILEASMPGSMGLKSDLPSPGPAVMANATEIRQVFTNLITNAWEAVGTGRGSIHLSVKTASPADIPTRHCFPIDWQPQDNDYACLDVTDTDGGIADEDIEKLFDPFFTSKFTGRGMGLPLVLGIVKAHGGAITVESELGRGSTFRVFLPLFAAEVPLQLLKAAPPLAIEGSGTVLLVDDDEMLRNMAAAMLTRLGFTVLSAKDGVEAMELFRQHKDEIRLVLSDLTMPRMNGWETLMALRQLAPGLPVILASGYDKAQVMAGDHPELPQVFLGKPYGLQVLKEAIGQALVSRK